MKLVRTEKYEYFFQLDRKERQVLLALLALYPVIPAAHQRLSKTENRSEGEQLLEASLATQRNDNKRQIQSMVHGATTLSENQDGCALSLSQAQMEWLLQVLNDVRVGSWIAMGSPNGPEETLAALNMKTGPHFWALEMAGHFQMEFLRAIRAGEKNNPAAG
jgi:hypothetical protein